MPLCFRLSVLQRRDTYEQVNIYIVFLFSYRNSLYNDNLFSFFYSFFLNYVFWLFTLVSFTIIINFIINSFIMLQDFRIILNISFLIVIFYDKVTILHFYDYVSCSYVVMIEFIFVLLVLLGLCWSAEEF